MGVQSPSTLPTDKTYVSHEGIARAYSPSSFVAKDGLLFQHCIKWFHSDW